MKRRSCDVDSGRTNARSRLSECSVLKAMLMPSSEFTQLLADEIKCADSAARRAFG